MTSIDFYILPETGQQARLAFVCRWVHKAYRNGNRVFIAVDNAQQARYLDRLLWEFSADSFLPHDCSDGDATDAPVRIGYGDDCGDFHDCLLNLCSEIPDYFSRFRRLAEVVCQDERVLQQTRQHYGFLQHRGYPINTHKLPAARPAA